MLSSSLIWLASFAFVEALAVWGDVFVPIQQTYVAPGLTDALLIVRALLGVLAAVFLVQFGLRLLALGRAWRRGLTALSCAVAVAIPFALAGVARASGWSVAEWEAATAALARYALLFPGAVLSAVGLWRQRGELAGAGMTGIKPYAAAAAGVLAVYAVVGGLVVEPAPWTPGGLADEVGWFAVTGFPLAIVRGVAGLALCVAAVKLLEIFDVEAKQRVEAADRARAVAEERARFRRDLHDGTIQSIYAAGLHLEAIAIRCDDRAVRGEVREVVSDLNEVTDGVRHYIRDLAQLPATPRGVAAGLEGLTRHFAEETGRDVRFRVEGVGAAGPLPPEAGQHLEQVLREALANSARHAGPCRVDVALSFARDELDLSVRDDGCGMSAGPRDDGAGHGLRNMHERARRLGGRLTVTSPVDAGTRIDLAVPLDSEELEPEAPAPAEARR